MNRIKLISTIFLLLFAGISAVSAQTSAFSYQGRLNDNTLPANGTYEMEFKLFDSASGGTQVASTITNNSVAVQNGIFSVTLDFGANPFAAGANRFLEIGVRKASDPPGFTTLAPRQQLTSSPYSLKTISADLLSSACVGCVTDPQISSISGSKVVGNVNSANSAAVAGSATIAGNVSGIVDVIHGGTGSSTKSFVDLSTDQTAIGGNKTFTGNVTVNGTLNFALGQTATTVYGTSTLSVTPSTTFTIIPGMTQTVNVPAGYKALVIADGGIQTTSSVAAGFSTIDVALHIDGFLVGAGGYKRVIAMNNGGNANSIENWSLSSVQTLTAGSHIFTVRAAGTGGISATANVSGDSSTVLQGELTVILIKN
ncbi:MAG TPA: hypothetical protein PKY59_09100 [Pyrinomonadaceae bacterium]|nr:hypothetical protein [Pyrinomonadaceae bacterium]